MLEITFFCDDYRNFYNLFDEMSKRVYGGDWRHELTQCWRILRTLMGDKFCLKL